MREIKFRAKTKDTKEWVYGSYVRIDYHNSVDYVDIHQIILTNGHSYEVIPETIGQYIGLRDKNKIEIYEGDIVTHRNGIQEVTYIEELYAFDMCVTNCVVDQEAGCVNSDGVEVIGNIFDNPDLLKQ
jgi:uncharacterized phage protein (TIGR01671 family)